MFVSEEVLEAVTDAELESLEEALEEAGSVMVTEAEAVEDPDDDDLKIHMRTHSEEKPYAC